MIQDAQEVWIYMYRLFNGHFHAYINAVLSEMDGLFGNSTM